MEETKNTYQAQVVSQGEGLYPLNKVYYIAVIVVNLLWPLAVFYTAPENIIFISPIPLFFILKSIVTLFKYREGLSIRDGSICFAGKTYGLNEIDRVEVKKRGGGFYLIKDFVLSLLLASTSDVGMPSIETSSNEKIAKIFGIKGDEKVFSLKLSPTFIVSNFADFIAFLRSVGYSVVNKPKKKTSRPMSVQWIIFILIILFFLSPIILMLLSTIFR